MMKITKISRRHSKNLTDVLDSDIGKGYIKTQHGSMPDVDVDYDSDRRQEVKEYLERRYNKNGSQRVFSAGTFITERIKSVIKDVARVHKVSVATTNYINAILDDNLTWTDLMRLCFTTKKVRDFVQKNWEVFEEILPLLGQPRSAGVHASAVIITPEIVKGQKVECFDLLPIKKVDNMLVSELSGNDIDAIGILKNDVLGIAELTRLSEILSIIKRETGRKITMLEIVNEHIDDPKVFEILQKGLTQGVFQLSSEGMTRFIKQMKPSNINDLIAANALFRPATLNSGAAMTYIDCKNGTIEPEYLWGTYDILKDTYGVATYQEQFALLVRKIGNLSIGDGVNLVKAISKKKIEKIRKYKDKYFEGIKVTGCPKEAAEKVWDIIEVAASYGFNKSHATAYALTAYVGAWLKTYYPVAFYTVLLKWVDTSKLPSLMSEMGEIGNATVVAPDINISGANFYTDYSENKIYWSLARIKYLGVKAVSYIEKERAFYGGYFSLEDFISRIFRHKLKKYESWDDEDTLAEFTCCPVNARNVRYLIMAGAFDKCENLSNITGRYNLLEKAAEMLGFEISENEVPPQMKDKEWFWSQQQIAVSGMGMINYEMIFKYTSKPSSVPKYVPIKDLEDIEYQNSKVSICATVSEVEEKTYKDSLTGEKKTYGKLLVQQNSDVMRMLIWNDAWIEKKDCFINKKDTIVVAVAMVKYSEYDNCNVLQVGKRQFVTNVS